MTKTQSTQDAFDAWWDSGHNLNEINPCMYHSFEYWAWEGWHAALEHPAQRTWVGLTDKEMESIFLQCGGKWSGDYWKIEDADFHPFLRTIKSPQRPWVGLTEEEQSALVLKYGDTPVALCLETERKLKEKNT
jgi:hypothetical protein